MQLKFQGRKKLYSPKDADVVRCEVHGTATTWGAMDEIQRLALSEGIDTCPDMPCLIASKKPLRCVAFAEKL